MNGRRTAGPSAPDSEQARELINASIPNGVTDRAGWIDDIYASFTLHGLAPTRPNVCAVAAVIEQESNFQVNPLIPDLGKIAQIEIQTRAKRAHVPLVIVHSALQLRSSNGQTYNQRIDAAHTERDLSDIYEDFIGSVPLGHTLFADWNPIRTRGAMQVSVVYAAQYAAATPYPYPIKVSIADELFTRRGSLYFGVAHLLAYEAPYREYLFRFADFNAGQYASRNAAFQYAVSKASGISIATDGALLSPDGSAHDPSATELAVRALATKLNVDDGEIHDALEQGKTQEFEQTTIYQRIFALAEHATKVSLPRAMVPTIKLQGPKISRHLTTSWYAHRVAGRFERCLAGSPLVTSY
ncbi:MAG: DUF1615 domain-containing protein [Steroidobacteraceae bacterium]